MRIFIDETGSFVVPTHDRTSFCCLGALVIPDATYDLFCREFAKLSRRWPNEDGEIKGAKLKEPHVLALAELLNCLGATYFFSGADMSFIADADTIEHRDDQAARLLANLTPEHNPALVRQLEGLSEQLKRMPPQLYAQFVLLTELVNTVIRSLPVYYSITRPRELGSFTWMIDAKNNRRTEAENLWALLAGPIMQSKFQQQPPYAIEGADNSEFDATYTSDDQAWPAYMPAAQIRPGSLRGPLMDIKKLLGEKLSFADSKDSLGLQAVDVITNAMRRTFHGQFNSELHEELAKLMLVVPHGDFSPVINLSPDADGESVQAPYVDILLAFQQAGERKFQAALRQFFGR